MRRVRLAHERERVSIDCSEGGRTKQSFREECDINHIIKKFESDGIISHTNRASPAYTDNTTVDDLQDAMEQVAAAEAGFDGLQSSIREAAGNDPMQLLEMLAAEEGRSLLEEAGMDFGRPKVAPSPAETAVVMETQKGGKAVNQTAEEK